MHQHDRQCVDTLVANVLQRFPRATSSSGTKTSPSTPTRSSISTTCSYSIVGSTICARRRRAGPITNAQRVAEAARNRQRDRVALELQQGVRRHSGADAHLADGAALLAQDAADRFKRCIFILTWIFRQQLFNPNPPVGRTGDDIGKGAAAIDGEFHEDLRAQL